MLGGTQAVDRLGPAQLFVCRSTPPQPAPLGVPYHHFICLMLVQTATSCVAGLQGSGMQGVLSLCLSSLMSSSRCHGQEGGPQPQGRAALVAAVPALPAALPALLHPAMHPQGRATQLSYMR
jgi:hypothetical protein